MGLQGRTIQKLLREDFPGATPLVVADPERAKVGADLKARLERVGGVETKNQPWIREEEKPRQVCAFTILDPDPKYSYCRGDSFRVLLDDAGRLTIKGYNHGESALVSDLDEVVEFIRHCKQRLERQKALRVRRGKMRDLLAQAILAQVRKLAREERFAYMSETAEHKLNLYVKLSDENAILLHIPFKEFKQFLPHLRSAIVTLRQLYQNGIRFQVVSRRGLPWRKTWITPEG